VRGLFALGALVRGAYVWDNMSAGGFYRRGLQSRGLITGGLYQGILP